MPPRIKKTTWMTSVHETAESPPYKEYATANKARPTTPYIIGIPMIVSRAREPRYNTEARFTNTYSAIQKTARMVLS